MNCDAMNGLLDALMDGELTEDQRREMEAHAGACPDCAAALRSMRQLKALFDDIGPEVDVPLEAQARWRNAVREEAARRRKGKLIRWVSAAAAAVVALVGVGLVFNLRGAPRQATDAALIAASEAGYVEAAPEAVERNAVALKAAPTALIEADGGGADLAVSEAVMAEAYEEAVDEDVPEAAAAGAGVMRAPACEIKMRVDDVDMACSRIRDLAEEYEGAADAQYREDGGANLYVTIDAADVDDFLSAVTPMDASGSAIKTPALSGEGPVLLLLTVQANQ